MGAETRMSNVCVIIHVLSCCRNFKLKTNLIYRDYKKNVIYKLNSDDSTVARKDKKSFDSSIKILNDFCNHAGSKMNINKTEFIVLEGLKDMCDERTGSKQRITLSGV